MPTKVSYSPNSTNLEGAYQKQGANLKHLDRGFTLVIGTRKNPTLTKPPHYLLLKQEQPKRFTYISSLFPVGNSDSTYSLDAGGRVYHLTISGSRAQVTFQGSKG